MAEIYVPATYGCGGCEVRWTGLSRCHCAATQSASLALLAVRDSDTSLLSQRYPHLHKCPVDTGGVTGQLLADLLSAKSARVQAGRLPVPPDGRVFKAMIGSGRWTQVVWSVVSPVPVDVVNFLLSGNPAVEDAVFVGLDMVIWADGPPQSDVAMRTGIPMRFALGDLLPGLEVGGRIPVPKLAARATKPPLRSANDLNSAGLANDDVHNLMLQVSALCHRTFNGIELFDRHRMDVHGKGTCLDPATITAQPKAVKGQPRPAKTTTGQRVMWETDGIWRSVENPVERQAPKRNVA